MADVHFDVVVVGGAVVGSATAYFLARHAGFRGRVLVLERDPSYQRCATTRSAASIRQQFSTELNIRLSQFGVEFLRRAPAELAVDGETPALGFVERGYLFLATPAGWPVAQQIHAVQRGAGADVGLLDAPELARRFPWLAVDDLAGGSLGHSGEGWFDAHALLHAFKRKAQSLGVSCRAGEVVGFEEHAGRVRAVRLADGARIEAGCFVNAAGTGAAALAASVGIALPVRAKKRCVFHFASPAQVPDCGLVIDPSGVYFRPEGGAFIGGTAPPPERDPDIHDLDDFDVDPTLFEDLVWPVLARRVPGFEALRVLGSWAGHYDMNSFDANVIVGAHPSLPNLLFANGFSGHGLQQSPAIGRALAEWICEGAWRSIDLAPLSWQRVIDNRPLVEAAVV